MDSLMGGDAPSPSSIDRWAYLGIKDGMGKRRLTRAFGRSSTGKQVCPCHPSHQCIVDAALWFVKHGKALGDQILNVDQADQPTGVVHHGKLVDPVFLHQAQSVSDAAIESDAFG